MDPHLYFFFPRWPFFPGRPPACCIVLVIITVLLLVCEAPAALRGGRNDLAAVLPFQSSLAFADSLGVSTDVGNVVVGSTSSSLVVGSGELLMHAPWDENVPRMFQGLPQWGPSELNDRRQQMN